MAKANHLPIVIEEFDFKRGLPEGKYKLSDIFTGLDSSPELIEVFGEDISKIANVTVVITEKIKLDKPPYLDGKLEYAYINNGEIHIGTGYIRNGRKDYIYLDMIHELVHIKQHWDGLDLFDLNYSYINRPTEVEAYKIAYLAAKRIGMTRVEISEYLEVPWVDKEEMMRLENKIGLDVL